MMKIKKDVSHNPAAMRQIGFKAYKNYLIGALCAGLWIFLVTIPEFNKQLINYNDDNVRVKIEASKPQKKSKANNLKKFEKEAAQRFPMLAQIPSQPTFIALEPLRTDASIMRNFKNRILDWERRTGKSFLSDHSTMKETTRKYYTYIATNRPDLATNKIPINRIQPTQGFNNYVSPQLWEISLDVTMDQVFTYKRTYLDDNGYAVNEKGFFRTYSGNGICYDPESTVINGKFEYSGFHLPVICGEVWREFIYQIFHAKTDEELLKIDPINQTIRIENASREKVRTDYQALVDSYTQQVQTVENQRLVYVREQMKALEPKIEPPVTPPVIVASDGSRQPHQARALLFFIFAGSIGFFTVFLVAGGRYAIFSRPFFIPGGLWFPALMGLIGYVFYLFYFNQGIFLPLFEVTWAFVIPFLFLFFPTYKMVAVEWIKEEPLYRRWFVLGRGGEASRLAGIRSYIKLDMDDFFSSGDKIKPTETSQIYLGKTLFENDFRVGGRHVGLKDSEQHMLTVAMTGAGKSRDAILNTLLNYSGGVCAFDMKGELTRITHKRRTNYAPFNNGTMYARFEVLDPYGQVSNVKATSYWNPLNEIPVEHPAARDLLKLVCDACIFSGKQMSESSEHFIENSQNIFRGFIAHVKTAYPRELQHLGTVYDLLKFAEPGGTTWNKNAWEILKVKMLANDALGSAAPEAIRILDQVGQNEAGSYFSTLSRSIDWINSESIRKIIASNNEYNNLRLSELKEYESSIFLVLPEMYINANKRFLRTFYTMAFAMCDDHITPQPEHSKKRTLFLFDEFNKLGHFEPAEDAVSTKRSSNIKCWFIAQNYGQLLDNYSNADNIMSQCTKQFFGVDTGDARTIDYIKKALGGYVQIGEDNREHRRGILNDTDIAEICDLDSNLQLVIPSGGLPLKLRRTPYYKNFSPNQYGS